MSIEREQVGQGEAATSRQIPKSPGSLEALGGETLFVLFSVSFFLS